MSTMSPSEWIYLTIKVFDAGVPIIFPEQHCALRLKDRKFGYLQWYHRMKPRE